MDAFVLPSRFETWGLVLNEAMLFQLPVIASSMVGATEDLIETGKNGFVFDVGNVARLTDSLRTLVDSAETRSSFGWHSRAIVEKYSHDVCLRGTLDALGHVTGRPCIDPQGLETRETTP
jgi:glycosyltransferase involved in cell wall biosynthesis